MTLYNKPQLALNGTIVAVDMPTGVFWMFDARNPYQHSLRVIAAAEMPGGYGYSLSEISTSNILEYRGAPTYYVKGTECPKEEKKEYNLSDFDSEDENENSEESESEDTDDYDFFEDDKMEECMRLIKILKRR